VFIYLVEIRVETFFRCEIPEQNSTMNSVTKAMKQRQPKNKLNGFQTSAFFN